MLNLKDVSVCLILKIASQTYYLDYINHSYFLREMSENITFHTSVPTSPANLRSFRFISLLLAHLNIHKLHKIAKL